MRFTLQRGQWYAAEILGEEFGERIRSYTRIKVYEVKPLGGRKFGGSRGQTRSELRKWSFAASEGGWK